MFVIMEKAPTGLCLFIIVSCLKCESSSSCFQPRESPVRGLLRDYEPSCGHSFQALVSTVHTTYYGATLGLVVTDDDGGVGVAVAAPWPGGPVVAGGAPAQLEAVPVSRLPPPDPAVPVLAPDAHLFKSVHM